METLSHEVTSYVEQKYNEDADLGDTIAIRIISDETVNEDRVRKSFHNYISDEETVLHKERRRTRVKQIWLFIIGIIFKDGLTKGTTEDG